LKEGEGLLGDSLTDSYVVLVSHGYLPPSEGYPKAKEAARKALELDETLAEAHTSLGSILSHEWDWAGAEREFTKALRANPNYATAHHWYSIHLMTVGRLDEAIKELKIAEELDPLSPMIHTYAGQLYFYARQYDVAAKEFEKALELDPNFVPAHGNRADLYLVKSMFDETLAELKWLLPALPSTIGAMLEAHFRSYVCATTGRTEEAKRIILECEEKIAHERNEDIDQNVMTNFAIIHSKLGDKERALEWLRRCFEVRAITPYEVKLNPEFDEINSNARFDDLMKKTIRSLATTQE
jgi:tetratricopeptide (TPR) repeat protein